MICYCKFANHAPGRSHSYTNVGPDVWRRNGYSMTEIAHILLQQGDGFILCFLYDERGISDVDPPRLGVTREY